MRGEWGLLLLFVAVLRLRDERKQQKEEEESRVMEGGGDSSKENSVYDYGRNGDDSGEESDGFMEDRQTDEDYSAFRETMFDWSPRKRKEEGEKRVLVEEINDSVEENESKSCKEVVGDFEISKETEGDEDAKEENDVETSEIQEAVKAKEEVLEGCVKQIENEVDGVGTLKEFENAVEEKKEVLEGCVKQNDNVVDDVETSKESEIQEAGSVVNAGKEKEDDYVGYVKEHENVVLKEAEVGKVETAVGENKIVEVVPKEEECQNLLETPQENEASDSISKCANYQWF